MEVVKDEKRTGRKYVKNFSTESEGTLYLYDCIGCHIHKRPSEQKDQDMADKTNTWVFHVAEAREKNLDSTVYGSSVSGALNTGDVRDKINSSVSATVTL